VERADLAEALLRFEGELLEVVKVKDID